MEQLCRNINMPEEVTAQLLAIHRTLPVFPCLDLLMEEATWEEGLKQLKAALGEDPDGLKQLCCMLRCALRTWERYEKLGISEEIYIASMAAFSRFVREHMESYGRYGFDRGFWTTRQVSAKLFRIGQLEYELTAVKGQPMVSLHIPTDVDLRPEILRPSVKEGLEEFFRIFPDYAKTTVFCHSWLMSPMLKDFLPEGSNILRFQELFDIDPEGTPDDGVVQWVFRNPKLAPRDFPENTSLQRKLKQFFLAGGRFLEGKAILRRPL